MFLEGILRPLGVAVITAAVLAAVLTMVPNIAGKCCLLCGAVAGLGLMLWRWQLRAEDRAVIRRLVEHLSPVGTPAEASH